MMVFVVVGRNTPCDEGDNDSTAGMEHRSRSEAERSAKQLKQLSRHRFFFVKEQSVPIVKQPLWLTTKLG